MALPAGAFALKRMIAEKLRHGVPAEHRQLLRLSVAAPVYVLPPTKYARCPAYVQVYRDQGSIPLPHKAFIIETLASSGSCVDFIESGTALGAEKEYGRVLTVHPHIWKDRKLGYEENRAIYIDLRNGAFAPLWSSVDELVEGEVGRWINTVLDCICTIMHRGTRTTTEKVPPIHRRGLLGLKTGWEYRLVEIPEGFTDVTRTDRGGSHASPIWHIRRGHLRHLHGGLRVVPVRECEVGDKSRGGLIKDYDLTGERDR